MDDQFFDDLIEYFKTFGDDVNVFDLAPTIRLINTGFIAPNLWIHEISFIDNKIKVNQGSIQTEYELSKEQFKNIISILLDSEELFIINDLPVNFTKFKHYKDPRIQALEQKRLSYTLTLTEIIPQGFSIQYIDYLQYIDDESMKFNKFMFDFVIGFYDIEEDDIIRISLVLSSRSYTITNNEHRTFISTVSEHDLPYLLDELFRHAIPLRSHDLMSVYTINIEDPTIKFYDQHIKEYLKNSVREPFSGENPRVKILQSRQNIGCNSNGVEDLQPIDPIDFQPIPENLLVTVVPINYDSNYPDINNQTSCYNAQNLWEYWKDTANRNPPKPAIDPLTNNEFDAESIVFVKSLI